MRTSIYKFLLLALLVIQTSVLMSQSSVVSLEIRQQTREYTLQQLEKISGYSFVYSKSDVRTTEIITVHIKNRSIMEALKIVLGDHYSFERIGSQIAIRAMKAKKTVPQSLPPTPTKITLRVLDEISKTPLPYASISIQPLNKNFLTDESGQITFYHAFDRFPILTVTASYIGRAVTEIKLTEKSDTGTVYITMPKISLSVNAIDVNVQRQKAESNSSIQIGREAIESIQAYSLAEVLQLLPGKAIVNTDLQNAQFLTLRSVNSGAITNPLDAYKNSEMNDYMRNTAFGIGFFIDGVPISNNANMQTDSYGKWGEVKVFDRRLNPDNNNYAGSGIDLRQLPASSIENVEIISGVAPVKYGDISDGAVLLNRKAGISPWNASVKFQNAITSISLSKGHPLGKKHGILFYNVDLLQGTASANNVFNIVSDKRNKLKSYTRVNTDLLWTRTIHEARQWKNTLSLNLYSDLDGIKNDPDAYLRRSRTQNYGYRLANRGQSNLHTSWADQLSYSLATALGVQNNWHEEYIANASRIAIADGTEPGLYETDITPPYYTSTMEIKGMPFSTFGRLELDKQVKTGNVDHTLLVGLNINYDNNFGKGKIFDAERPYYLGNIGGRGDRSYDFRNKVSYLQMAAYINDNLQFRILGRNFYTSAGLRIENQQNTYSISPRINSSYELTEKILLTTAYGISRKAPAQIYLHPENVYFDYMVLGHYNDDYNKRLYLVQTFVKDVTNHTLTSTVGETMEFGLQFRSESLNGSLTAYQKTNSSGITSRSVLDYLNVPLYETVLSPSQTKPMYRYTGVDTTMAVTYYQPINSLYSRNRGLELLINIPKIESIKTMFNLSAVYNDSYYYNEGRFPSGTVDLEREAIIGIYEPGRQRSSELISTLSVTHHLPKLGFIFNWRLQNFWLRHHTNFGTNGLPVAYINKQFEEIPLKPEDLEDIRFAYLIRDRGQYADIRQPAIIPNYHIRISKDILRNFRISFYANNLFNHRPYTEVNNVRVYFNQPPTFGVDMSIKIN